MSDKFFISVGKIAVVLALIYIIANTYHLYLTYIEYFLMATGLVTMILVIYLSIYYKKSVALTLKTIVLGVDLDKSMTTFIYELPNPKKESISSLITSIIIRFSRIGAFLLLVSMMPLLLVYNQNTKIESQNTLIETQNSLLLNQNETLNIQNQLVDADRRSALVFMFNNILDAIDDELKQDYDNNDTRDLSPQLIGRIIAISQQLGPYKFLESDTLVSSPLSPERGQLLVILLKSNLDSSTLNEIMSESDFSFSSVKGITLKDVEIRNTKLDDSRFENVKFENVKISSSSLYRSSFKKVHLSGVVFDNNDFYYDFRDCTIDSVTFENETWLFAFINERKSYDFNDYINNTIPRRHTLIKIINSDIKAFNVIRGDERLRLDIINSTASILGTTTAIDTLNIFNSKVIYIGSPISVSKFADESLESAIKPFLGQKLTPISNRTSIYNTHIYEHTLELMPDDAEKVKYGDTLIDPLVSKEVVHIVEFTNY